jgi:antitoxin VapB
MPLNIKNADVEALVAEIAAMTGETKTEAVRRALAERRDKLVFQVGGQGRGERLRRFLTQEVWPTVPPEELGRRMTREEEDALLGYGPQGV